MPVRKPLSVPITVLAAEKAFWLRKNVVRKNTIELLDSFMMFKMQLLLIRTKSARANCCSSS
ncbi:hypothetical protein PbDSM24746_08480 [Paenibacillus macerans]|nr:hypothetical protein PbDSM24746_08480 [Paenibacillus macerans]GBK67145.1 hypothetical protein PbJCM17693_08530 [Paenibacillus macerans]